MTDLVETDHRDDILDLRATTNQVPPLVGHNVVTSDLALTEAVTRHGSAAVVDGPRRPRARRRGPRRPASTGCSPTATTPSW